MSDQGPRSAIEIAMERLRQQDRESGVERRTPTDAEKARIAEIRNTYTAKLAQEEVMHASALAKTRDPGARAELEERYRRERAHLVSERDAKIERIREGEAAGQS